MVQYLPISIRPVFMQISCLTQSAKIFVIQTWLEYKKNTLYTNNSTTRRVEEEVGKEEKLGSEKTYGLKEMDTVCDKCVCIRGTRVFPSRDVNN